MSIDLTPKKSATGNNRRMFACIFRQKAKNHFCPETPLLEGKTALVTGGGAGVGEFVSRGLLKREAEVISLSRGVSKGTSVIDEIESIKCDLAEPASVVSAVDELAERKFDIVICNSGIMMPNHQTTSEGIEKTFAVNVFGHHLLYRLLIERGMLADNARIVMTTGEVYVMTDECLSKPEHYNGNRAYAGSKLGNLWQVLELAKRYPNIQTYAVHPGVVLSGFGGAPRGEVASWLMSKLLISEEEGAQSALIAATQDLPNGAYWHNVVGVVDLPSTDAAKDEQKSVALWDQLETLTSPWL